MKRKLIAFAAAAAAAVTIGAAGTASADFGDGPLQLSLHRCAPGTFEAGRVSFQNVGYNDYNEGARNHITIRLCSLTPHSPVYLTPGYCGGRRISTPG